MAVRMIPRVKDIKHKVKRLFGGARTPKEIENAQLRRQEREAQRQVKYKRTSEKLDRELKSLETVAKIQKKRAEIKQIKHGGRQARRERLRPLEKGGLGFGGGGEDPFFFSPQPRYGRKRRGKRRTRDRDDVWGW